ncbi:hypothetical protein ACWKT5_32085 [Streptomyces avermitilis]
MAKRKVRRQARRLLGEDPVALVWCEVHRRIPRPPEEVHRAAGKGRLKPGHHWLLYVGAVLFFFVVVPMMLIDRLGGRLDRAQAPPRRQRQGQGPTPGGGHDRDPGREAANGVFDGDWSLTAGQLLLRWYGRSPNPKRLVLLTRDRVCLAASPRRRLSPTRAGDFRIVAEFPAREVSVEGEAGQPRGFATFRLCFSDGSWLEVGRLGEPEDADHFLHTIND